MREHCKKSDKICTQCKLTKPITEFYLTHKKQHRMGECKTCYGERVRKYREQNLEKCKATDRAYYYKNSQKNNRLALAYQKKFRKKISKQAIIRYFVKKLKEEFQVDLCIKTQGQTLDELTETHKKLKLRYKYERKIAENQEMVYSA